MPCCNGYLLCRLILIFNQESSMKRILIYIIVLITVLTSCSEMVEEIDWNAENIPNKLIVEGDITNETGQHPITLRHSDYYFANSPSPVVSGATVSVLYGSTVIEYSEDPKNPGTYKANEEFAGEINQEYTLTIGLSEELDGADEYSAATTIIEGMRIDSISAELYSNPYQMDGEDSTIIILLAYGQEPEQFINYYLMKLYRNDTLLSDTIVDYPVFSDTDNGMNGEKVLGFFLAEDYSPGDIITLELYSIPKDYKIFLDGVNQISQPGDPFGFSGPPANAVGNVNEGEALGFFYGAYVARGRTSVKEKREGFYY